MILYIKRDWKTKLSKIYPILLAGGHGSRLWPLSRKSYPKQFSQIIGEKSLFQGSAQRLTSSKILEFASHITITNSDFRFIVGEQLQNIGIDPGPILIEPQAKNTAAAVLAASIFVNSKDENAILLVAPSDHLIPDTEFFHKSIKVGLTHVLNQNIVTFGIKPSRPETGYGYLELSTDQLDLAGTSGVLRFVEKPDLQDAKQMLETGHYLWNAGIFLFRARDMIDAFITFAPETLELVTQAISNATKDLGFLRLSSEPWSMLKDISIDYAIMEKIQNLVAVPYDSGWSDLGGWDAVWSECELDSFGNMKSENVHAIDCSNSLLRSESSSQQLVGLGLDNIITIAMPDAVLVAHKSQAQNVKKVVKLLKMKNIPQAETFPKDYRPWGWFESLAIGNYFQVKRICVKPGSALSLQSHKYRSEHWVVVEGTAKVTVDGDSKIFTEGKSVYIPLGAKHRLENTGKSLMIVIEVQIGTYLGEDDIIRYEDIYSRS
ncbi:mannose-1-phosphate guanylyltransferase/mannose-6-phosphate isomerase [Alphaproteobacteria bacterium]|nr:mannose-1-phosphate guanylyltransferase/mannose-6-phosphate isomerase [Alphaproteobacteria bacterium]